MARGVVSIGGYRAVVRQSFAAVGARSMVAVVRHGGERRNQGTDGGLAGI
jgi:hypothetical protein